MAYGTRRRGMPVAALVLAILSLTAVVVAGVVVWQWPHDPVETTPWATPAPVPAAPALSPMAVDSAPPTRLPTGEAVASALSDVLDDPALGDHPGVSVLDGSGRPVFDQDSGRPTTPASTLKVLTTAAVLATVGPDARLPTSVVAGDTPDRIVLVGGGDPSLTREPDPARERGGGAGGARHGPAESLLPGEGPGPARLPDLAAETAKALRSAGTTEVQLSVDDSLFSGPTASEGWLSTYVPEGYVAPVTALAADAGRVDVDADARESDPSLAAGKLFAGMLEDEGIEVTGTVDRAQAPEAAKQLARVQSPPVATLVEHMLAFSDNDYAEVMLRQAGRGAGHEASFTGGARAVRDVLGRLGIDSGGVEMFDGSGLSRSDRVPPRVLSQTLAAAANEAHPDLRPLVTSLPVAGFTGTLADRFSVTDESRALGLVRAKTGTLTGVGSLAGVVRDTDGNLLVFALMTDEGTSRGAIESALDEAATALASCGCAPAADPTPSDTGS